MKRSVAILGPTPAFIRWTLRNPCRFRDTDVMNQSDAAFRQLRGLRALSEGYCENRIHRGICLHADNRHDQVELARGFPVDEVLQAFGGKELVQSTCGNCPANIDDRRYSETQSGNTPDPHRPATEYWAGCFGMIPMDLSWVASADPANLKIRSEACDRDAENSLADLADLAISRLGVEQEFEALFLRTQPAIFGAFADGVLSRRQSALVGRMLKTIEVPKSARSQNQVALSHLISALEVCSDDLPLFVEIIPKGYSDGSTWTIVSHCSRCHSVATPTKGDRCVVCGQVGGRQQEIRSKVLGFRPYMLLHQIIGPEKTAELLAIDGSHEVQLRGEPDE